MGQSCPSNVTSSMPVEEISAAPPTILHFYARAWVGGLALAWEELSRLARSPSLLVARGEAAEKSILKQLRSIGESSRAGSQRVSASLRFPFDWAVDNMQNGSVHAEVELERQIQQALDRLGIPSRERLMQLGAEIDALAERIDAELERQ